MVDKELALGSNELTSQRSDRTAALAATGQARSGAGRSADTVKNNAAKATGRAKAQTAAVIGTLEDETVGLLNDASESVDPQTMNPASFTTSRKKNCPSRPRLWASTVGRRCRTHRLSLLCDRRDRLGQVLYGYDEPHRVTVVG
jgi:hypothetical protein